MTFVVGFRADYFEGEVFVHWGLRQREASGTDQERSQESRLTIDVRLLQFPSIVELEEFLFDMGGGDDKRGTRRAPRKMETAGHIIGYCSLGYRTYISESFLPVGARKRNNKGGRGCIFDCSYYRSNY